MTLLSANSGTGLVIFATTMENRPPRPNMKIVFSIAIIVVGDILSRVSFNSLTELSLAFRQTYETIVNGSVASIVLIFDRPS